MITIWKELRMQRIINPKTKKTIIIPIDHWAWEWVMPWLEDMKSLVSDVSSWWADAILGHMWTWIRFAQYKNPDTAFIYHLSVSTRVNFKDKNDKVLVNSVESALCMWADWISVHVNIWSDNESEQLKDLWFVAQECYRYWLPLLAMMYPRWEGLTNDPKSVDMVSLAIRVWAEIWADIVKTYYTWDIDSFKKAIIWATVPVVIVGWGKSSDEALFKMTKDSIEAWASWLTFWRNAFQHPKRVKFINTLRAIVHDNISVDEALKRME